MKFPGYFMIVYLTIKPVDHEKTIVLDTLCDPYRKYFLH